MNATQERIPLLLVDDDRLIRTILAESLREAGYEVTEASNGKEALKLSLTNHYPIIMTDWVMPEIDGLEFCRRFRNRESENYSYLILLTSQEGKDKLVEGLEAGADEYLTKPVADAELAVRLKTARRILELESSLKVSLEETRELSRHDPLTGLYNRLHLNSNLPVEIKRSIRYMRYLSVVMLDIDHFKMLNDRMGHQCGDAVLRHCSSIITGNIRKEVDWAARYGGEEFVLILPETDQTGCLVVAERLRSLIASTPCHFLGQEVKVTASFGTLTKGPADSEVSQDLLLRLANNCLYEAKQSGRNMVVTSQL